MRRTQVQFTDEQLRRLRQVAERQKRTVAEVIRDGVETYLTREERNLDELYERAKNIAGMCKGGPPDLAENHDEYYAQATEEHIRENRR